MSVVVLGLISFPGSAVADEETEEFSAAIEISLHLEIFEQNQIDFGTVGRPSSGTNQLVLDWDSGDLTIEGDGDAFYVDGADRGRYRIQGPADETVEITTTIGDFGVDGIEVEETHMEGETNSQTVDLNPSGFYFAEVGGVLTLTSDAPAGVHTADFFITANHP